MFEKFTDRARKVMALANQEAQRFNHEYIRPEHYLLGLAKETHGAAAVVLARLCIDPRRVRLEVEKVIKPGPETVILGRLPQTPAGKRFVEYAVDEAHTMNSACVGTEHLLLGLLRDPDSTATSVLTSLGATLDRVRECVASTCLGGTPAATPQPPPKAGTLSITDAVVSDLHARREFGRKKYGTELQAHNGRDALIDAYQEALDLCLYLKQAIEDRAATKGAP